MSDNRHDPQSTPLEERSGPTEGGMEQMEVVLDAADFRPDSGLRSTPEMRWLPIAGLGLAALLGTAFAIGAAVSGSGAEDPELAVAHAVIEAAELSAAIPTTAAAPPTEALDQPVPTDAVDESAAAESKRAVLARRSEPARGEPSTAQPRAKAAAPQPATSPAAPEPTKDTPTVKPQPASDGAEAPASDEPEPRGSLRGLPPPPEDADEPDTTEVNAPTEDDGLPAPPAEDTPTPSPSASDDPSSSELPGPAA